MTVASHTAELEESTAPSRPLTYTTTTITLERVTAKQHWIHTCKEGIQVNLNHNYYNNQILCNFYIKIGSMCMASTTS